MTTRQYSFGRRCERRAGNQVGPERQEDSASSKALPSEGRTPAPRDDSAPDARYLGGVPSFE
jgi:hypothetical protein